MILDQKTIASVTALAASSDLARYNWKDRGVAPMGYTKGIAVCYALCLKKLLEKDSAAIAMTRVVNDGNDVFDHYESRLRSIGLMTDGGSNIERLRALFVVVAGLGPRESSGRYCEGRDMSASNTTSDTAEAGAFQQSYNTHTTSPEIDKLMSATEQGFLDVFKEGVTVHEGDLENCGSGNGRTFQATCKTRPSFAVQVAAIGLRTLCNHWGPINEYKVEVRPEADKLFKQVQELLGIQAGTAGKPPSVGWWKSFLNWWRGTPKPPDDKPIGQAPWMPWVLKEVGFHETGVNRGIEKYIDLSRNGSRETLLGEPWCADFSNAAFEVNGIRGTRSAMARSYEDSSYFVELSGPAYGAVVTMWRGSPTAGTGHVFFYTGENARGVWGVGGNQSDSVSLEPHSRNNIVGYYWPKSVPLPKIGKIAATDTGTNEGSQT